MENLVLDRHPQTLVLPSRRDQTTLASGHLFHSDSMHTTGVEGETLSQSNRLPFGQDKEKHETDVEGRWTPFMYLLALIMLTYQAIRRDIP